MVLNSGSGGKARPEWCPGKAAHTQALPDEVSESWPQTLHLLGATLNHATQAAAAQAAPAQTHNPLGTVPALHISSHGASFI